VNDETNNGEERAADEPEASEEPVSGGTETPEPARLPSDEEREAEPEEDEPNASGDSEEDASGGE